MNPPRTIQAWALLSDVTRYRGKWLPVVFQTRRDAEENRDPDERIYRVTVTIQREAKRCRR
jgi:hypothetical protein